MRRGQPRVFPAGRSPRRALFLVGFGAPTFWFVAECSPPWRAPLHSGRGDAGDASDAPDAVDRLSDWSLDWSPIGPAPGPSWLRARRNAGSDVPESHVSALTLQRLWARGRGHNPWSARSCGVGASLPYQINDHLSASEPPRPLAPSLVSPVDPRAPPPVHGAVRESRSERRPPAARGYGAGPAVGDRPHVSGRAATTADPSSHRWPARGPARHGPSPGGGRSRCPSCRPPPSAATPCRRR